MTKNIRFQPALVALAALLAAVGSAQAQVAARDADGTLRAPTAEEAKALEGAKATGRTANARTAAVKLPVTHANGMVTQELDESYMMYSVVRRNADGSLSQFCVTGSEAAERIAKSKATTAVVTAKAAKGAQYEVK